MSTARRPGADARVIRRKVAVPPQPERLVARPALGAAAGDARRALSARVGRRDGRRRQDHGRVQAAPLLERPVAWLTLDATDAAPGRLVTYLEAALAPPRWTARERGRRGAAAASRTPRPRACSPRRSARARCCWSIDELERLADAPEALAALGGLLALRAADACASCSSAGASWRSTLGNAATLGRVAAVGEADLAFTTEEAAQALADVGRGEVDPIAAVRGHGRLGRRRALRGVALGGPRRRAWAARPTRSTATCRRRSSSSSTPTTASSWSPPRCSRR